MPNLLEINKAELATAVFRGLGCQVQVNTNFFFRTSPNFSFRVSIRASSWQGCTMVSILITGTDACRARDLITASSRSPDQSWNNGNARNAIKSQYRDRTPATSAMCSSASPSITVPGLNSTPQASLPGCRTMAIPPSCCIPSSNEVRVRSDGLRNIRATDLPRRCEFKGFLLRRAARPSRSSNCSADQSAVVKKVCISRSPSFPVLQTKKPSRWLGFCFSIKMKLIYKATQPDF